MFDSINVCVCAYSHNLALFVVLYGRDYVDQFEGFGPLVFLY